MQPSELPTGEQQVDEDAQGLPFPVVREVGLLAPFEWLAKGAADLASHPGASIFYGVCFAFMGLLLSTVFSHAYHLTSGLSAVSCCWAPSCRSVCTTCRGNARRGVRPCWRIR
jgi:hypothetical protein